ncbi:MAG TPA: hypothetical protein VIG80_05380 [Bacillaceae bacterium]
MAKKLGLHESLDVHELFVAKSLALTKATTMSGLAKDGELKKILEGYSTLSTRHLQELEQVIGGQEAEEKS